MKQKAHGIYCWKRSATSDEPEDIKVDLIQQHSQRTSWLFMSKRFFYLAAVNLAAFFINYHVLLLLLHNTFDKSIKEIIDNHN